MNTHTQQADMNTAQPYHPEILPDMEAMQQWSDGIGNLAHRLASSMQKIVSDLRHHWTVCIDDAEHLEQERVEAIRQINEAFAARLDRIEKRRVSIEAQIDFYTGQPRQATVEAVPASNVAIAQPRPTAKTRARFLGMF